MQGRLLVVSLLGNQVVRVTPLISCWRRKTATNTNPWGVTAPEPARGSPRRLRTLTSLPAARLGWRILRVHVDQRVEHRNLASRTRSCSQCASVRHPVVAGRRGDSPEFGASAEGGSIETGQTK